MLRYIGSLIVVSMLCLGSSAPAWAGDPVFDLQAFDRDLTQSLIRSHAKFLSGVTDKQVVIDSLKDALIRQWAKEGEICRVLGHVWETQIQYAIYTGWNYRDSPEHRKCRICGREEVKTERWEKKP